MNSEAMTNQVSAQRNRNSRQPSKQKMLPDVINLYDDSMNHL